MYEEWIDEVLADFDSQFLQEAHVLQNYFNGTITAHAAAEQLTPMDPGYMLVYAARDLFPAHNQLVELVAAAKQLDSDRKDIFLQSLYIEIREAWNDVSRDALQGPDKRMECININHWVALLAARFPDEHFLQFGLNTIAEMPEVGNKRESESNTTVTATVAALNGLIPSAAYWILSVGQQMYADNSVSERLGVGTCRQNWARWKGTFQRTLTDSCLNDTARDIAKEAIDAMEIIQGVD